MSFLAESETPQEPKSGSQQITESNESRISLVDVWRVLLKRRFWILGVTILVFAATAYYTYRTKSIYQSNARIEINSNSGTANLGLQDIVEQSHGSETSNLQTEIQVLQSDSILLKTAELLIQQKRIPAPKFGNLSEFEATAQRMSLVGFIRGGLQIRLVTGTHLVDILYRHTDPELAKDVVNDLVEAYRKSDLQKREDHITYVSGWLQNTLEDLKKDASEAQRKLAEFQKQNNIVGTDENNSLTFQNLQQINSALQTAESNRILKEARLRDFESQDSAMRSLLGDDPRLGTLRNQRAELQTEYDQLSLKYGKNYPKMQEMRANISQLDSEIKTEVGLSRSQIEQQYLGALHLEEKLRQRLGLQEEEAYKLNEGAAQYAILRHEAELNRTLYDTLQVRLKEASVAAGLNSNNITVIDSAELPLFPIAPQKRQNMMFGLLGGVIAGVLLAFLMEAIDDTLPTSDEVESALALPSLATIPHIPREMQKGRKEKQADGSQRPQVELLQNPQSIPAEGYRGLRSSLMLSSIDRPPRVIVVTSAFASEGKTTTTVNCAVSFAQRGERVLLVDADLRKGRIGQFFKMDRDTYGLTSLLAQPMDFDQQLPAPLPEVPTLFVLPTGPRPPNPAEILSSNRMEEQLKQWLKQYDRIVIDTAPLLPVSDTQALAAIADTVVLVARAGATRKRALLRARDLLLRIHARVAGVVVNDVDLRIENFYTYRYGMYGYGAYGYQYGDTDSRKDKSGKEKTR